MKITLSGVVGSGKSTISKMLVDKLSLEYFCIGNIMREIAEERGVSFQEFMEIIKTDSNVDFEVDERQRKLNDRQGNFIVDSRLGFYFIPDSFKIFLKLDINESARRIYNDCRNNERYDDIGEAVRGLNARMNSEKIRYKNCYGIDFPNEDDFDLVIDTTNMTPDEVVKKILDSIPGLDCEKDEERG